MTVIPRQRVLYLLGPGRVELREEAVPTPATGELVLRVVAATTCGTDLKVFRQGGHPRMLRPPCPFGHEVAGQVAMVGADVDRWRAGDDVVVVNSASCGACPSCAAGRENLCHDLQYLNGAYADHLLVPARFVARSTYRRPPRLAPTIAAMTEPLACVHHGLEACGLGEPSAVIVVGAGPIGLMFTVELALLGHRVTVVDRDARRCRLGSQLGAAAAVVVTADGRDAERLRAATTDGVGAPLVVEATGSPAAWALALAAVRPGGTVVLFGGCPRGSEVALDTHRLHYSELTVKGVYHHRPATVRRALERLAADGPRFAPLIEREFTLDDVPMALEMMAQGRLLKAAILP